MSGIHNKKRNPLPAIIVLLLILIPSVISGVNNHSSDKVSVDTVKNNGSNMVVHFLDVGQGDSEFVELPGGKCMLIDAGTADYSQSIIDYISSCGYSTVDYVVATHPHADHIGGMSDIIDAFAVGEIYMPKVSANTKTFERLLTAVSNQGITINTAKAGREIYSNSNMKLEFLAPLSSNYDDLNNYSAVLKITYGKNAFLFTGDAEDVSENEMLESSYQKLGADVIKIGHHGSSSSATLAFLKAVTPRYAVISCGVDNAYGHPHSETLNRLERFGIEIYRTDTAGTVTVSCDGNDGFDIKCEAQ